jgi:hypothetical protein
VAINDGPLDTDAGLPAALPMAHEKTLSTFSWLCVDNLTFLHDAS